MISKYAVLSTLQLLIQCQSTPDSEYGVDISWPIHSFSVSTNYPWLPHNVNHTSVSEEYLNSPIQPLGDRQTMYNDFMKGCFDKYSTVDCMECEKGRIASNLERTKNMVNFTELGFKKVKAPREVFQHIQEFYNNNFHLKELEGNEIGETTNNHWISPTYMVNMENSNLRGGEELRKQIWSSVEDEISEWVNLELKTSALYGIRVYTNGAILSPHIDDLPRICSAIINVAQDVDEDWPLEVIGHNGKAYNVTMEPGDMILYESHSLIHGRLSIFVMSFI